MSINLSSNFLLSANLPLDGRTIAADITARNAIPVIQRYPGLTVYVAAGVGGGAENWQLQGGIANTDWVLVGGGGTLTGLGSAECVAYWINATTLASNIFFKRYNVTGIVANAQGFTSMTPGTVTDRYIDPAGNNTNSGVASGGATAWLTPGYAIKQCQQMGPGLYRIHVAPGLYNGVDIDAPQVINWTSESAGTESVIEFVGDEVTPTTTAFQNTVGSICYHSAPGVSLRFAGIDFRGSGSQTAILHSAGKMYFRNCTNNDHYVFYRGTNFGTLCVIEQPFDSIDTYYGFGVSDGASLIKLADVTLTPPSTLSLSQDPTLYSVYNGFLNLAAGKSEVKARTGIHLIVGHGWIFDGYNSTISIGSFTELLGAELKGLWRTDGCRILPGNLITFHLTSSDAWLEMTESFFQDRSGNSWISDSLPPEGVKLGIGAKFISPNIAALGTPPTLFFDDYMTEYVNYIGPDNYLASADDNRYTETFCDTIFGEVPQGYGLADIGKEGVLDSPEYIFIATESCEIYDFRISTTTGNGAGNTDTYYVAVNGSVSSLSLALTNTSSGVTNNKLRLVAGNKVSLRLTSSAGTTAENITYQLKVRRYR